MHHGMASLTHNSIGREVDLIDLILILPGVYFLKTGNSVVLFEVVPTPPETLRLLDNEFKR